MVAHLIAPVLLAGLQTAATAVPADIPATMASDGAVIPAGQPVEIEIVDAITSKTAVADATFAIRLHRAIRIGDVEVVPAGTPGVGQIVHAAKARLGGKPGELVLAARFLEVAGTRIPLRRFALGGVGRDNSDAAVVSTAIVPLAGLLISGGERVLPAGSVANALVAADTRLPAAR